MTTARALVLTSTSHRHRYFASTIGHTFSLAGVMTEQKKNYFEAARQQSPLVETHFKHLAEEEYACFGTTPSLEVKEFADLNSPESIAYAKSLSPDVVCLFGTSILKEAWLEAFPRRIVNLHLGLSPYYRGSATLFWPFYFKELHWLGTTIHLAVRKVDAGEILRRVHANLLPGDNYYTSTTRLIRDSIDVFPKAVWQFLDGNLAPFPQETIPGRLLKKADFTEATLKNVLEFVGQGLTLSQIDAANQELLCHSLP